MNIKTSFTAIGSFVAALGTYAGLINSGALAQLDFIVWDGYTLNQMIWLVLFMLVIGISAGLLITSGASLESTISELGSLTQEAMNASDKEFERQKNYAKKNLTEKLETAKNSLLDKIKATFSKKREVNAAILEPDYHVIPPQRLLSVLQEKVASVRAVMLVAEAVQTQLEIQIAEEADPQLFIGQKKSWIVLIITTVAAIAVIAYNIWLTYGGSAV